MLYAIQNESGQWWTSQDAWGPEQAREEYADEYELPPMLPASNMAAEQSAYLLDNGDVLDYLYITDDDEIIAGIRPVREQGDPTPGDWGIDELDDEGPQGRYSRKHKEAHHMWEAEKENGKFSIKRTKHADEEEMFSEKQARRVASQSLAKEEAAMACLGVWSATLVDDELLTREIARPIVARFNAVQPEDAPRVHTWEEIGRVIGAHKLAKTRQAISDGMRTRLVSKSLNVPFLVAAELIDKMDGMDLQVVKRVLAAFKSGDKTAGRRYASIARDIQSAFARFGGMRLAVDDKAKKYFEDYFGPYGAELVADIQRRVRADLAYKWLTKYGVDAAAAEYWSTYFSENGYGAALVGDVAKRLSPAGIKDSEGTEE